MTWGDLVHHVLAHVAGSSGLAASVHDRRYVAYCERRLGSAAERPLGEDAEALARLAPTHAELARASLLAWLFRDVGHARAAGARALGELSPNEVSEPVLLAPLRSSPAAELLWCACLLEHEVHARLPALTPDRSAIERGLRHARAVAPGLGECDVRLVRSLCLRGRVRGDCIWVGVPDAELGVSIEHVLWQASHEATVRELGRRALGAAERAVEHAAVVLLAERAERAGRAEEHGRWLAHFGSNAPPLGRGALSPAARRLLDAV